MMEPADVRHLGQVAAIGGVDLTRLWAVHLQRSMGSPGMVVAEVVREDPPEMTLVDHDDVIKALAADGPDEPLYEGILPRASRRCNDLLESHPCDPLAEDRP